MGGEADGLFEVDGVAFDSREVEPGHLFIAMKGEATDGHRFVDGAFAAGAAGALVSELGLNYAACDFIKTPDDRHVFLEVNAVGEFFWLQRTPGLPIVEAIADVLTGRVPRRPVDTRAWTNFI